MGLWRGAAVRRNGIAPRQITPCNRWRQGQLQCRRKGLRAGRSIAINTRMGRLNGVAIGIQRHSLRAQIGANHHRHALRHGVLPHCQRDRSQRQQKGKEKGRKGTQHHGALIWRSGPKAKVSDRRDFRQARAKRQRPRLTSKQGLLDGTQNLRPTPVLLRFLF